MAGFPSVAVVIVNANAGAYLERCLESVDRQTTPPQRTIVVDNASSDGSADAVENRHAGVEVIRLEQNVGFAAANNLAVSRASDCEWIALLNPDAFPETTWLESLLRAAEEHREFTFFGSMLVRADGSGQLDGTGDVYHVGGIAWRRDGGLPVNSSERRSAEIFSPCAAAALYRRDIFLSVGGFDESFFCYYEDSDLAFRLRLAGHRCLYVPDAVVAHVGFATAGEESPFTVYHSQRNLVWTWTKNMPVPLVWIYLPQHLLVNLLNVAWGVVRGQGRAVLAAKRDALRDLPRVLRERRRVQSRRTVPPSNLLALMARGPGAYVTAVRRAFEILRRKPTDQSSLRTTDQ